MIGARLYLWEDRFLWASRSFKSLMTRRYATNVVVAISSQPFVLSLPGGDPTPCHGAICSSRALRRIDAVDVPFLSLNFDPGSIDARKLEQLVTDQNVLSLPAYQLDVLRNDFLSFLEGRLSAVEARTLGDRIVSQIIGTQCPIVEVDQRIMRVASHLKEQCPTDIDVSALAELADLSASRLMHLFSEEMGLSMSQFLLWTKMRHAAGLLQSGRSMTDIALTCGFSDSSHLTRAFRTFYGVKPSVLANSSYVQLRLC